MSMKTCAGGKQSMLAAGRARAKDGPRPSSWLARGRYARLGPRRHGAQCGTTPPTVRVGPPTLPRSDGSPMDAAANKSERASAVVNSQNRSTRPPVGRHRMRAEPSAATKYVRMVESPEAVGQGARFVGCAAATLGAAVNGYTLCVVAGAVPLLSADFGLSTLEKALVISLNVIGAMIGGIAGGIIADSLGRRP
eukprot:scaffold25141_cov96-Isochrysis_galbana.AAC.1